MDVLYIGVDKVKVYTDLIQISIYIFTLCLQPTLLDPSLWQ